MSGRFHCSISVATVALAATIVAAEPFGSAAGLDFGELAPLPDQNGFAGMYAGTSRGVLIAAGGTNFPERPFEEGGSKRWYDHIFVLHEPKGEWRKLDTRLPRPLAHGVAVTYGDAVICIGGASPDAHHADVFEIRWNGAGVALAPLASLPAPSAYMAGAIAGDVLFIAGGQTTPEATHGTDDFWALDLSAPPDQRTWRRLPPWPGPPRHRAVAAALGNEFLLLAGVESDVDEAGKVRWRRPLLTDAYRYTPARGEATGGWTRLASLPRAAVAAASPALVAGGRVYIFGGVHDELLGADPRDYPGFPRDVPVYDAQRDVWTSTASMPAGTTRVVPGVAAWEGRWVFVSGETGPGRRSPRVITTTLDSDHRSHEAK